MLRVFLVLTKSNGKNIEKTTCTKCLSPQDRRLQKIRPKAQSSEFGTKNPTHQKSTGNNPPNQLVSTQFFLDVLLLEFFVFPIFLRFFWWVFPQVFHL